MAKRKGGLGRGLDALLSQSAAAGDKAPSAPPRPADSGLRKLPIEQLERGAMQPRVNMHKEALEDLAASIREQGIVQPILVREITRNRYEIVAGERRWRAAQLAGLHEVPAIVRELDDADAAAIAIIENIQRADLNPLEEAHGLERLKDEHGMTHQAVADAVGRSRAAVTNLLRLLELHEPVKQMLMDDKLEMGHARALLSLSDARQLRAAHEVVAKGLSVRATERLVKQIANARPKRAAQTASKDPDVQRLENELGEKLGTRVQVVQGKGGAGKIQINYNSLDELDGILDHLR